MLRATDRVSLPYGGARMGRPGRAVLHGPARAGRRARGGAWRAAGHRMRTGPPPSGRPSCETRRSRSCRYMWVNATEKFTSPTTTPFIIYWEFCSCTFGAPGPRPLECSASGRSGRQARGIFLSSAAARATARAVWPRPCPRSVGHESARRHRPRTGRHVPERLASHMLTNLTC